MAKASSRKKAKVGARKKAARRSVTKKTARMAKKKSAVRRVSKRVAKKVSVKRNLTPARYYLKVGAKYFDGAGLTPNAANACYYSSGVRAAKIGTKLAHAIGRAVSVHSNKAVKKK